jgi:hypothetical protein
MKLYLFMKFHWSTSYLSLMLSWFSSAKTRMAENEKELKKQLGEV